MMLANVHRRGTLDVNPVDDMKYVVVSGGVLSGIGKGVTASSIGVLLKSMGLRSSEEHANSDWFTNAQVIN